MGFQPIIRQQVLRAVRPNNYLWDIFLYIFLQPVYNVAPHSRVLITLCSISHKLKYYYFIASVCHSLCRCFVYDLSRN